MSTYLLISLGSIGKRHLENLQQLDSQAKIVVLRHQASNDTFDSNVIEVNCMQDALDHNPKIAIIASPAVFHVEQALVLLRNDVHLFIEKPLSHNLNGIEKLQKMAQEKSLIVMIGYVLRFSPLLNKVKSLLEEGLIGSIISASAHCGQYLPDWRPEQDYRETVSAKKSLGGGVLLELSHEFDYLRWLFGDVNSVVSNVINTNTLKIDVEDKIDVLMKCNDNIYTSVHLNFLQKKVERTLLISGMDGNIYCNLVKNYISIDAKNGPIRLDFSQEKNNLYLDELSCFLDCVRFRKIPPVTLRDGVAVVKIVESVKRSSIERKWVDL